MLFNKTQGRDLKIDIEFEKAWRIRVESRIDGDRIVNSYFREMLVRLKSKSRSSTSIHMKTFGFKQASYHTGRIKNLESKAKA